MNIGEGNDDNEEWTHPLFLTSLPSGFQGNHHLAALASLLEEEDDNNKDDNYRSTMEGKNAAQEPLLFPQDDFMNASSGSRRGVNAQHVQWEQQYQPSRKLLPQYGGCGHRDDDGGGGGGRDKGKSCFGKVHQHSTTRRTKDKHLFNPYPKHRPKKSSDNSSVGEAQLFFRLWNLE